MLSRGTHGGFLTVNLAFGFAVMLGILISGQVSGTLWMNFTCDNCRVGLDGCAFPMGHWYGNQCPLAHLWDPNSACKSAITTYLSAGGHLNPAVTFAMCFLAREPWIKLPIYALAQTLGAFLGAGIVFGLYYGKCRNVLCLLG